MPTVRRAFLLALCLSLALAGVSLKVSPATAATPDISSAVPAATPAGESDGLTRPDAVSAAVTARTTGRRVEDVSQRTETTSVFANPDGSWTAESAPEPVRVQDDAGDWHPVDTSLVQRDGGLAPAHAAADVVFSGGGDRALATVREGGKDLVWQWPTVLPEPVVDGDSATYRDVVDGGDLVVTADSAGFSHSVVLREQPTEPVEFTVPVTLDGASMTETARGSLVVTDKAGDRLISAPPPLMWDSSEGAGGLPENVAPVDTAVETTTAGKTSLVLAPDDAFLADPDTVYPVVVDPSFTTYATGDTWVMNADYTSSQVSSTELRAGSYDGGPHRARSFVKFFDGNALWGGKHVTEATLRLRNFYSGSCTGSAIRIRPIAESWIPGDVTWTNQPAVSYDRQADYSPAHGYSSSCPADNADFDVTNIVDDWAQGRATNYGIRIAAVDETSIYSWRKYRSANHTSTTSHQPKLIVSYNSFPGTATQPSLSPSTTWAPPGGASSYYTSTTKPTMTSKATDPDGGTVRIYYEARSSASASATLLSSCTTGYAAQGTNATCTLDALPDNSTVSVRAKAYDGTDWAGKSQTATEGWSSWRTFKVAATNPPAPVISCAQGYNTWTDEPPADPVDCTITATGSGTNASRSIDWTVTGEPDAANGTKTGSVQFAQSPDPNVAKASLQVANSNGGHTITATATSPAGRISTATYAFGYGKLALASPTFDPVTTTANTITVTASGPPALAGSTPKARLRWRVASSGADDTTGWNEANATLKVTDKGAAGLDITGSWDSSQATRDGSQDLDLDPRVPVMFDVQLCVDYNTSTTTACTWSVSKGRVLRVPHAFGAGFPVTDVGPGQVAQWTGEFTTSATDAVVPGLSGDLSVSRAHSTFDGPAAGPGGVFGPGWTAQLDGPGAGLGGLQAFDDTLLDGTIAFVDPSGEDGAGVLVFAPTKAGQVTRRSATATILDAGTYHPVDDATALSGIKLEVSGTGTNSTLRLTEPDGTMTTFRADRAPAAGIAATFRPESVQEPGSSITSYTWNGGKVTRILAPRPAGVTGCADPGETTDEPLPAGTLAAGCRQLRLVYASSTTATSTTPGDIAGQVKSIWFDTAATSTQMAEYAYDSGKRLVAVTDTTTGLVTEYGYDGATTRLAKLTPPGLEPWTIGYDTSTGSPKVSTVTRTVNGSEVRVATLLYDVPLSTVGLPDLSAEAVAAWGQAAKGAPTHAYAAFRQDADAMPTDPSAVADWKEASLAFTDDRGYTRNTAEYGAGRWLLTATDYDDHDNVTWQLDTGDIARIQGGETTAVNAGTYYEYHQVTHPDASGKDVVTIPAGTVLTDTYSPARTIVLPDGTTKVARPHTHTDYDQGAPNHGLSPAGTGYGYPTTETVTSAMADRTADIPGSLVSKSSTGYDAQVPGTASGWDLGGLPTRSTTVMADGQADITTITGYDSLGRIVETRQPSSKGNDAGTRRTMYYTADDTSPDDQCDNKPAWAGTVCVIRYQGDPATGPGMTLTRFEGYNHFLSPTKVTDSSDGAVRRTAETSYDAAGRVSKTWTYAAASLDSPAAPGTQYTYDPNTGLVTGQQALDGNGNPDTGTGEITTGYDDWGRPTSYTPAVGETTTTRYDAAGRVDTITDPKGTTTYTYDGGTTGIDAAGRVERRGLPTSVRVDNTAGGSVTFTGAYNADGALVEQTMPGALTQAVHTDEAGDVDQLTYSGQVTADDGTITQDSPWLGWAEDHDTLGRTVRETTPGAAGYDGSLTGVNATGYARIYDYDRAGRLTHVEDYTAPTGSGGLADNGAGTANAAGTDMPTGTVCQTRDYTFDTNGNRTSLARTGPNTDGTCGTLGGTNTSTRTWSYDTADRLTGGYTYDALGRATTIPAADTPAGISGATGTSHLTLGYFADDSARTVTQNGTTTTFTLDPAGRRARSETAPASGGAPTETIVRHYTDDSDNPTWTETTGTGTTASTTTRYAESLGGDLAATLSTGTAEVTIGLALVNLHGDAVSTVTVPSTGADSTGLDSWVTSDEYGNPLTPSSAPGGNTVTDASSAAPGIRYGWLGGEQRATIDSGLLLMGARLYNPSSGQFTSTDAIYGGNTTAYAYPQDPINTFDLDGREGTLAKIRRQAHTARVCASFGYKSCVLATGYTARVRATVKGDRDKKNFIRHFVWMVGLAVLVGRKMAKALGDAHEFRLSVTGTTYERRDSARDLANNAIALRWFGRHSRAATRTGFSPLRAARRLWRRGVGARL